MFEILAVSNIERLFNVKMDRLCISITVVLIFGEFIFLLYLLVKLRFCTFHICATECQITLGEADDVEIDDIKKSDVLLINLSFKATLRINLSFMGTFFHKKCHVYVCMHVHPCVRARQCECESVCVLFCDPFNNLSFI